MHQELVENRRWISESPRTQFLYGAAWSGSSATLPPWLADAQDLGRSDGEFVIYPSLTFYSYRVVVDLYRLGRRCHYCRIFYGIKPTVAAIVLQAAHRVGSRALKHGAHWGIAAAAFVAFFRPERSFSRHRYFSSDNWLYRRTHRAGKISQRRA
jgi:chromate transporter